jgi:Reverse transcriptase (RNA-dependent DNA polymerase)
VVYVDNLLLATASWTQMDKIKSMLTSAYKMHNLGPAKCILGMHIQQNCKERTIALSQQQYTNTVLERFGMSDCKPVFTPMETKIHPSMDDPVNNEVVRTMRISDREVMYQSIVGSLMWLTLGTRPNLAYTTSMIGRYSANPKACH